MGLSIGLLVASGCGGGPASSSANPLRTADGSSSVSVPSAPGASVADTSTPPGPAPFTPTTVSVPAAGSVASPPCAASTDDTTSTAPPEVAAALAGPAADRQLHPASTSISVWIEGWGEVLAVNPDLALVPASNQKLLTASAALGLLDPAARPHTAVVATGPTVDGVVQGDLVLVGGGDPDLTRAGPRSVDALAQLVVAAGITGATGRALIDEHRYDDQRSVAGWPDGTSAEAGAGGLGALVIDRNRGNLGGLTMQNATVFAAALHAHGVNPAGPPGATDAAVRGGEVAGLDGPTYTELIGQMLQLSDGLVAESVVKELGRRSSGTGSTAAGLEAVRSALAPLCVTLAGVDQDGSGFSYGDARARPGSGAGCCRAPDAGRGETSCSRRCPSPAGPARSPAASRGRRPPATSMRRQARCPPPRPCPGTSRPPGDGRRPSRSS